MPISWLNEAVPVRSSNIQPLEAALSLVSLPPLMERTRGAPSIRVGLIDGPATSDHPSLKAAPVHDLHPVQFASGSTHNFAALHATATAAILVGSRDQGVPSICPGVTLLSRPIFMPWSSQASASSLELAKAIVEMTQAGVHVLNMSLSVEPGPRTGLIAVERALVYAASRGVVMVAASGDGRSINSTVITGHPAVIPVVACNLQGRPAQDANLGRSVGRRGLSASGDGLVNLSIDTAPSRFGGSSAATAVVTGAIALLRSLFPGATSEIVRHTVLRSAGPRTSVVPPLLDAWRAYEMLHATT
jgi:subtilisin family serine protease